MASIRKKLSVMLCPESTSTVTLEGPVVEFVKCSKNKRPKQSAIDDEADLVPLTIVNHIHSIDFEKKDNIWDKLLDY